MCHIAPSSQTCPPPNLPENHRVCDKQQHGYRSPSSLLAGLKSDIQRDSQVVLNSIKESYFHGAFQAWKKNDGITVYILKEYILKDMTAKIV
jgi:hypothetical protein